MSDDFQLSDDEEVNGEENGEGEDDDVGDLLDLLNENMDSMGSDGEGEEGDEGDDEEQSTSLFVRKSPTKEAPGKGIDQSHSEIEKDDEVEEEDNEGETESLLNRKKPSAHEKEEEESREKVEEDEEEEEDGEEVDSMVTESITEDDLAMLIDLDDGRKQDEVFKLLQGGTTVEELEPILGKYSESTLTSSVMDVRSGKWNLLHYACEYNNPLDVVKAVVKACPSLDVNTTTGAGSTALHCAANRGSMELFEYLLSIGADIRKQNNTGYTTLHFACLGGNVKIVKKCLDEKINVNLVADEAGWTPLFLAVRYGHLKAVGVLVEGGADPNFRERLFGNTVLHLCAFQGNEEMIETLIRHGGDVSIRNNQMWTCLHFAVRFGHQEIARMLVKKNPKIAGYGNNQRNTALHLAAINGDYAMTRFLLLQKSTDKYSKNKEGHSAKRIAMETELEKLFEMRRSEIEKEEAVATNKNFLFLKKQQRLYRFYEKSNLCDVSFVIGRKKVRAHSSILSRSKYLTQRMEHTDKIIISPDEGYGKKVDVKTIKLVMDWLYGSKKVGIAPSQLCSVYSVAKLWGLPYLQKFVCRIVRTVCKKKKLEAIAELLVETPPDSGLRLELLLHMKKKHKTFNTGPVIKILKKDQALSEVFFKLPKEKLPAVNDHPDFKDFSREKYRHTQLDHLVEHIRSLNNGGGNIVFRAMDHEEFEVHKEIVASSSSYFEHLFINKWEKHNLKCPRQVSLRSHSIFARALIDYSYCTDAETVDKLICLAIIAKEYELGNEMVFLDKIKKLTTKELILDVILNYGHLCFNNAKIKEVLISTFRDFYDVSLIGKLLDKSVQMKVEMKKLGETIKKMESKSADVVNEKKTLQKTIERLKAEKFRNRQKSKKK